MQLRSHRDGGRCTRRAILAITASMALALLIPCVALANEISSASQWPGSRGNFSLTVPAADQRVYSVPLTAGDWFIAYAWAPDTQTAGGSVKLYDPSASEVASPSIAVSSPNGILFWQAPVSGLYHVGFADTGGAAITGGMFKSRPTLRATTALSLVAPYNGAATLQAHLDDVLYNYVPFDGPQVGFETVLLSRSVNGAAWQPIDSHSTDVNGNFSRRMTGLTRKTSFVFDYSGAVYGSAGFGEARSRIVVVTPQVRLAQNVPTTVAHGRTLGVTGTFQPRHANGLLPNVFFQARKLGSAKSSKMLQSSVRVWWGKSGASPIRASLKLPAGTWAVRFYRPEDAAYAKTSTSWARVVVK